MDGRDIEDLFNLGGFRNGEAVTLDRLEEIDAEGFARARKAASSSSLGALTSAAAVVSAMRNHRAHNGVQLDALMRLAELTEQLESCKELIAIIHCGSDEPEASTMSGEATEQGRTGRCCSSGACDKGSSDAGVNHSTSSGCCRTASTSATPLDEQNGIYEMVLALQQFGADPRVCMYGLLAVGNVFLNLADAQWSAEIPFSLHVLRTALVLMNAHSTDSGVNAFALHALHGVWTLRSPTRLDMFRRGLKGGALKLLIAACQSFPEDDFVVQNALLCLLDILNSRLEEDTLFEALDANADALATIKDLYKSSRPNRSHESWDECTSIAIEANAASDKLYERRKQRAVSW